jgi:hypothetical protein
MGDHGATPLELEAQVRLLTEQLSVLQARLENAPAALPPPRGLGVKARKPEQFTGESNREDVSQWLFESERYFTLSGINPLEAVQYASSYLGGAAAIWWRSRVRQYGPTGGVGSWDGFVEALTAQFKPVNGEKLARDKLARLMQARSVQDYTSKFRTLCLQIDEITESEMLDRFVRGLKPHVQREVELRDPTTLDDAVRIAERVDAIDFRSRPPQTTGFPRVTHTPRQPAIVHELKPTPMELDVLAKPKVQSLTHSEKERLRKVGGCFYCRQLGHMIGECPSRQPKREFQRRVQHVEAAGDDFRGDDIGESENMEPQ